MNKTTELFEKALTARENAHAPYSNFKVGAALRDGQGRIFIGCNVENSSYGAAICAERTAITSMVAQGSKEISEILVITDTPNGCAPCGICRQVLIEFAKDPQKTWVHIATPEKVVKSFKLSELLPEAFDSSFLK